MDKNPLEITAADRKTANKPGRPAKAGSIKFTPQPKSAIIAQILREKILIQASETTSWNSQNQNTDIVSEDNTLHEDYHSEKDDTEAVQTNVDVVYEKRCKRTKSMKNLGKKPKRLKITKDKHEKKFACDFSNCSYVAKLACNLVKHKRIHTSEKPYICDQCPFRTNFINSLKVHRRIHTAEKPYNCECCGYRCNTISNLKKHKMHRHPEVAKI